MGRCAIYWYDTLQLAKNDGAGVLTFTNFVNRIEAFDLELVEFAFHETRDGAWAET